VDGKASPRGATRCPRKSQSILLHQQHETSDTVHVARMEPPIRRKLYTFHDQSDNPTCLTSQSTSGSRWRGLTGTALQLASVRAGFLVQGDQPKLPSSVLQTRAVLVYPIPPWRGREARLKRARAVFSARPEIEAALPLDSRSLYIQDHELANLASELDLTE